MRPHSTLVGVSICLALVGCARLPAGPPVAKDRAAERLPRVSFYERELSRGITARPERDWTIHGESLFEHQPPELARFGQTRSVILAVLVDPEGRVRSVEISESSGAGAIDGRAVQIARSWRFSPARNGGVPVSVWVDDARIEWPLVVLDGAVRPDITAGDIPLRDIRHVDICKGPRCAQYFGAPWARAGVIAISTRGGR